MATEFKEYTPEQVMEVIKRKDDIEIIDVREPEEWESGHIAVAKHIPLGEIPMRLDELKKDKEIIMVCRSGARSTRACQFLSEQGFQVINMAGGMLNWTGEVKTGK